MEERRPPSFISIVGVVWKVFFAILLIPALLLLVYVAANVFDPVTIVIALLAVAFAGTLVVLRRS
jgi:hypothetical protein